MSGRVVMIPVIAATEHWNRFPAEDDALMCGETFERIGCRGRSRNDFGTRRA